MSRSRKRRCGVLLFMGFSAAAILYSLDRILSQEAFQWIMKAETAKLFAAFCLSGLLFSKNWQKFTAWALILSVFSSMLTRVGFHMKYPFMVNSIPNFITGRNLEEKVRLFAKRLYGFFFCPVGPDI